MTTQTILPIDEHLARAVALLEHRPNLVVIAEPGAGKTTRLPPAILDSSFLGSQKILVLQPRRVAARTTARRIADERGVTLGAEIGYRIRFENKTSANTRLEILTEGLLLRQLQADPMLDGIGCVVLDEFHERSLNTDLGLALLKEVQSSVRPDLRIIVMSATLDPAPVAQWLDAEILTVPGRTYPVDMMYAQLATPRVPGRDLVPRVSRAIRRAVRDTDHGHILVFLPGVGEIERVRGELGDIPGVEVIPLHGRLSSREQDRAFQESTLRKVVLATNIAETSITIPGIRVVIDSGLAREPHFDPGIGMERLELVRVGQQSVDQRAGRAGRTESGTCYRLWTEAEHRQLKPTTAPEIQRADLASTVLQLHVWGTNPLEFDWFESPSESALRSAQSLLTRLGALAEHRVTPIGHALARLPVAPRLGRVMVSASGDPSAREVATVSALISERDIFHAPPDIVDTSDLDQRLDAIERFESGERVTGLSVGATRQIIKVRDDLIRLIKKQSDQTSDEPQHWVHHLLTGFPDRVAQRRADGSDRFLMANGVGARLRPSSVVRQEEYIVAVSLTGARRGERQEHQISLAHGITTKDLKIAQEETVLWDESRGRVRCVLRDTYGQLVLRERDAQSPSITSDKAAELLAQAVCSNPIKPFKDPVRSSLNTFLTKIRWLSDVRPELHLPELDWLASAETPSKTLIEFCLGASSLKEYAQLDPESYLRGHMGYAQSTALDELAPSHLQLPDGSRKAIQYVEGGPPILSTRFERLFGLQATPQIAGVDVMLELLAPNMRPIQTTQDLSSFWQNTYPMVRKELRGRYPKHPWPEDPLSCPPGIHRRRTQR